MLGAVLVSAGCLTPVSEGNEIHTADLTCDEANRQVYAALRDMSMEITAFTPAKPGQAGHARAVRDSDSNPLAGDVEIRCEGGRVDIEANQSGDLLGDKQFERGVFLGVTGRADLEVVREGRYTTGEVRRRAAEAPVSEASPGAIEEDLAFGTLASRLVDAVNLLTGNLDRPGGLMFARPATGQAEPVAQDTGPVPDGRFRSRVRGCPEFDGQLPVAVLAEEIDSAGEDRIRGLITAAGNPVLSTPNGDRLSRALASLEFMVSIDIYLNETTRHAHVILPTTTAFEETNIDFLFQTTSVRHIVRYSPRVVTPPAEAKPHWAVMMSHAQLAGSAVWAA